MGRQRRVKTGQTEVDSEYVSLKHEDELLGRYYSTVKVGSDEWFAWLKTVSSFSFTGTCAYVARNEKRKGESGFWYAYRWVDKKTIKVYIGKTETLTYNRLRGVCAQFQAKAVP
jgi:hypothetical protein